MAPHASALRAASCMLLLLIAVAAEIPKPGDVQSCAAEDALHVEDGFLPPDAGLRESFIQYLDSVEPSNPLGVVMVPAPSTLFDKLTAALRRLGVPSTRTSRFPELSAAAFAAGTGALPGKAITSGSKGCHEDFEVDEGFQVDNVVGPTDGRVGILYLSGEGEFILRDEATGAERREQIKPGRFISWRNTGHRHCVSAPDDSTRHFLGPLVLDATLSALTPVVDILTEAPPPNTCTSATDCAAPNTACVAGLCCTPAGTAFTAGKSFCCPGSLAWYASGKCCFLTGTTAASGSHCCSGRMAGNTCAPSEEPACLLQCKKAAHEKYMAAKFKCSTRSCQLIAAGMEQLELAYCAALDLPHKC